MDSYLKTLCKSLHGNVLTLGLSEKYISFLQQNKNIYFLECFDNFTKNKKVFSGKDKKIPLKKLHKRYKNKSISTIIVNLDHLEKYVDFLPEEIMKIASEDLYIIGHKETIEKNLKKWNRYIPCLERKEYAKDSILHYQTKEVKVNSIKVFFWKIQDKAVFLFSFLQDFLTNG